MGRLQRIVALALAALSAGGIIWCAVAARAVPGGTPAAPAPPVNVWSLLSDDPASLRPTTRQATTEVTITRASEADLRDIPRGRLDDRSLQVKLTLAHRLTMDQDDPLVTLVRQGTDFPRRLRSFIDDGFGPMKVENALVLGPTTRQAPVIVTEKGMTTVTFSVTMLRQLGADQVMELWFHRPTASPSLVDQRRITLHPGEWTVLQLLGITPEREERARLEFTAGRFDVTVKLVYGSFGFPDTEGRDEISWAPVLGIVTALVLVVFLYRALGTAWWRRPANRELVISVVLAAAALLSARFTGQWVLIGAATLFVLLPAVAVRHAARILPVRAPWTFPDVLALTGLAVLIAGGMLYWSASYEQVSVPVLATGGGVAVVGAAGAAAAVTLDLGVRRLSARLALVAAGAAIGVLALVLWLRAVESGAYPPDSVRLVLGLCWSLIPIAGLAVATRRWSRGAIASAVLLSLLLLGWPAEWLDPGSWSLPANELQVPPATLWGLPLNHVVRGALGLVLLTFALLVLRLRRLGHTLGAIKSAPVRASMIACLMILHLTPRDSEPIFDLDVTVPALTVTSLVAWAVARWLLAGPRPEIAEPRSPDEHRRLVKEALRRRVLHLSEQELFRSGRARLGAGELSMEHFERQHAELDQALEAGGGRETAFASASGCSPWENGAHAFIASLPLSVPFSIVVYGWPSGPDVTMYLFDARYLFTLPAFGFFFGYFYPRLRGTQPMTKALNLMAGGLVTELSPYIPALAEPDLGMPDKVQLVAIVVGQVAVVCMGLGLFWEWRIMYLAGEPWGRVRNIRSLRSLATPLVAVAIAAGTTAATSATGQTVDRILKGDVNAVQQK
ncbi:hypothetical protein [Nonomuraea sp. NPDC046570]|uniref:hypothetical protein n=1 Tax=Nonomuraea sp. NPDC046570 TaxID=3155255 RepID=UPI0033DA0544